VFRMCSYACVKLCVSETYTSVFKSYISVSIVETHIKCFCVSETSRFLFSRFAIVIIYVYIYIGLNLFKCIHKITNLKIIRDPSHQLSVALFIFMNDNKRS